MRPFHKVLGISGSLRKQAFSDAILAALAEASADQAVFSYADIGAVPHFNQDLYQEPLPSAVEQLRRQVVEADAIVIASPEYNHGMPGVLKNALDWLSRPHNGSPLKGKPVLILTSSPATTGGVRAQYQIRETLVSALAHPVATPEIVIGLVHTKLVDGKFADAPSLAYARVGLVAMFDAIV